MLLHLILQYCSYLFVQRHHSAPYAANAARVAACISLVLRHWY